MNVLTRSEFHRLIRALHDQEIQLSQAWEKAQNAHPYGAKATWINEDLKIVRSLANKLGDMYAQAEE